MTTPIVSITEADCCFLYWSINYIWQNIQTQNSNDTITTIRVLNCIRIQTSSIIWFTIEFPYIGITITNCCIGCRSVNNNWHNSQVQGIDKTVTTKIVLEGIFVYTWFTISHVIDWPSICFTSKDYYIITWSYNRLRQYSQFQGNNTITTTDCLDSIHIDTSLSIWLTIYRPQVRVTRTDCHAVHRTCSNRLYIEYVSSSNHVIATRFYHQCHSVSISTTLNSSICVGPINIINICYRLRIIAIVVSGDCVNSTCHIRKSTLCQCWSCTYCFQNSIRHYFWSNDRSNNKGVDWIQCCSYIYSIIPCLSWRNQRRNDMLFLSNWINIACTITNVLRNSITFNLINWCWDYGQLQDSDTITTIGCSKCLFVCSSNWIRLVIYRPYINLAFINSLLINYCRNLRKNMQVQCHDTITWS